MALDKAIGDESRRATAAETALSDGLAGEISERKAEDANVLAAARAYADTRPGPQGEPGPTGPPGPAGPPGGARADYDPTAVAKLEWGSAMLGTSIKVEGQPDRLVFDGAHVWVIDSMKKEIVKFRAADEQRLGAFPLPGGNYQSYRATFDGTHIWIVAYVTSQASDAMKLTKLRASDGADLGTWDLAVQPDYRVNVAFDGDSIWVPDPASGLVRLSASDGSELDRIAISGCCRTVAVSKDYFGRVMIWGGGNGVVAAYRPQGYVEFTDQVPGAYFDALAFDGVNVWAAYQRGVVKYPVDSVWAHSGPYTVPANVNLYPAAGIAFDGINLWVPFDYLPSGYGAVLFAMDGSQRIVTHGLGGMTSLSSPVFDGTALWYVGPSMRLVVRRPCR